MDQKGALFHMKQIISYIHSYLYFILDMDRIRIWETNMDIDIDILVLVHMDTDRIMISAIYFYLYCQERDYEGGRESHWCTLQPWQILSWTSIVKPTVWDPVPTWHIQVVFYFFCTIYPPLLPPMESRADTWAHKVTLRHAKSWLTLYHSFKKLPLHTATFLFFNLTDGPTIWT